MAKRGTTAGRAKLLLCIVGRTDEIPLTDACNECGIALHFAGLGYGTARSNYLRYFGLDEVEKTVVFSLIPDYCEKKILRMINKKLKLYLTGKGIAFTVPLSGISSIVSNAILSTPYREEAESNQRIEKKEEQPMHELIVAVVDQNYTDKVLNASRAAGSTGATVLHTHSVNNKGAELLIGTAFKQETDTILIITTHEYKARIMEEIRDVAGLKTEGGAVLYSLPVDSLIGIGRVNEEDI